MFARHYFPNLREPIVVWLLMLIGIFSATIALLLIVSAVSETRIGRCDKQIENQRNRRMIGSIIQNKLLLIGHHAHDLAVAVDEHELDVSLRRLNDETDEIYNALGILDKGGVIEEKLPTNLVGADEISRYIAYSRNEPDAVVVEVVKLTPSIHDLTERTDKLARTVYKRLSAIAAQERISLDKDITSHLKAVNALVHRGRDQSRHIDCDSARHLALLEAEREITIIRMRTAKYITLAVSTVLIAIVGGLILVRVSQNLAERERGTAELKRSKKSTQNILKKLPLGVVLIGRDKIVRYVNDTALSMAGYASSDELVGKPCHATLCPAQADRCPILQLGQTLDNSERVLITCDNRKVPILKTVIPIELNGEQVLLESFIDITERKKSEEMLRNYAKALEETNRALEESNCAAREANKAKSEFLANMSRKGRSDHYPPLQARK